ncbi:MAG: type II secretion system F family protein [Erysipelotrichaceae bacterium]|jgi:type IV pilus assembly protein PilC|nr:type II secretion system F family protein [Erysipelotrichaceae bacterium]MCR5095584.1 type II secretion system F family protein [Erysipelotrichaceae bacterium]
MAKKGKLDLLGVSAFCESMGMMIRSGIQLDEAISLFKQKDHKGGLLEDNIEVMEKCIAEGNSLKVAMEQCGIFPEYALKMIETGESTGKLEDVLFTLADYYEKQDVIVSKIRSALIYPLAMLVMIIIVLFIMLKAVLPSFSGVYTSLSGSLADSSYRYISYAYIFCRVVLIIMIILVALLIIGYLMYKGNGKRKVQNFLATNKTLASIMESLALYRFTSAYEVLLASGKMQDDALEEAKAMADYEPVEKKLEAVEAKMKEGNGFANAANEVELYEPIYGRMLIPGERSGNTDSVLSRLISLLAHSASSQLDNFINTIEPLLSGLLMLSIGIALLSLMLPLIGIMNSIG